MDNKRADRLIAVLERIAASLEDDVPPTPEERQKAIYDHSVKWLREHNNTTVQVRKVSDFEPTSC